jgi:hypothetical protein
MMRKVIVATLALSPMLLHAQANSPAQTSPASSSTTLQSTLISSNDFRASAADHSTVTSVPLRISTGVIAPKLVYTIAVESDSDLIPRGFNVDRKTVIGMVVDATGKPSDLKVVRSLGPVMDKNVLYAVSQYRFTPGTLDGEPAVVPVNLEVVLHTPVR